MRVTLGGNRLPSATNDCSEKTTCVLCSHLRLNVHVVDEVLTKMPGLLMFLPQATNEIIFKLQPKGQSTGRKYH